MEVTDWRCVSQAHVQTLVENAVDQHQFHEKFKPSLIIAAGDDALSVSRMLRAVLKARIGTAIPILTHKFDLYDEDMNPYNPNQGYWGTNSFSDHHILVVDKTDNSRTSLARFLAEIQKHIDTQKATASASSAAWVDPQIGVFVLHNKRRPKAADLPAEVLSGRYFACEECDNVAISYPFNIKGAENQAHQPAAHGDHPHLGKRRASLEDLPARPPRVSTPPPTQDTRMLSSHYVEEVIEKALQEQQVFEKFKPTALVAVCDDSLAPARILKHHQRLRNVDAPLPVLTAQMDLYDDDINPYNPIIGSWATKSLSGHRLLLVEKVVSTRATLMQYMAGLQQRIDKQRTTAVAAGEAWVDPVIGVFVLHDKNRAKAAELPAEVLEGRYFVAEHISDVHIAYPFHVEGPLKAGMH